MKIISFEGIEGVGKSTQIKILKDYLESKEFTVDVLREPGSTTAGEKIRDFLLNQSNELSDEAELLLMFAARAELIKHKIKTSKSDYILIDRFYDASIAYQGYGRKLSIPYINSLINFINCPTPNLTVLLDISVDEGFARKTNDKIDRIESSSKGFFERVRKGYLKIAKENKTRFIIINASLGIEEIHKKITNKIHVLK